MEKESSRLRVEIFTDGACQGNPGPGGWGVLLRYGHHEKELSGHEEATTNNRMELRAAIEGIRALNRRSHGDLYTDSTYVRDGIMKWIHAWKVKNWKTAAGKPVKNQDLWEELDSLIQNHDITWHWVKGHAGHTENERVDQLAREAILSRV